jgi:hypothetical protein
METMQFSIMLLSCPENLMPVGTAIMYSQKDRKEFLMNSIFFVKNFIYESKYKFVGELLSIKGLRLEY